MLPSPSSPILFSIGSFSLRWYSLCLLAGVLTALWFALKRAKKIGIHEDHIYNISFWAVFMGLVGARVFAVLYEPAYYFSHPLEIPQVWNGGLAIHGGVVFAAITIAVYCWVKKPLMGNTTNSKITNGSAGTLGGRMAIRPYGMFDLLVPSLLIGQIIGRFGNYFNQEAYGTPTSLPWGIHIDPQNRYSEYMEFSTYHPTFLYEALWNLLVLFILLKIEKKYLQKKPQTPDFRLQTSPGRLTAFYFIFYGIGRGLLEFIRTDASWWGPMRVVHWLSIGLIIGGTIFLLIKKPKVRQ